MGNSQAQQTRAPAQPVLRKLDPIADIDPDNITAADIRRLASGIQGGDVAVQDLVMDQLTRLATDEMTKGRIIAQEGLVLLNLLSQSRSLDIQKRAAATFAHLAVNDEYRVALVQQDCLKPIISLARVKDNEVRIWALWTLASVAEKDENKFPLVTEGVLPVLYDLSREQDARIKGYVAATLANLAKRDDIRPAIISTSGVSVVIELAKSFEPRVQSYAAAALAQLSSKDEYKADVVEGGCFLVLSLLGRSADAGVQCFAAATLANLSRTPQYQTMIMDSIGVPLLNSFLSASNSETVCFSAATLANLAKNDVSRVFMGEQGCIEALVAVMQSNNAKARRYAQAALQHLAKTDANLETLARIGGEELLAQLRPKNVVTMSSSAVQSRSASVVSLGASPAIPYSVVSSPLSALSATVSTPPAAIPPQLPRQGSVAGLNIHQHASTVCVPIAEHESVKAELADALRELNQKQLELQRAQSQPVLQRRESVIGGRSSAHVHSSGVCVPLAENEALKEQLAEAIKEMDALQEQCDASHNQLVGTQTELAKVKRDSEQLSIDLHEAKSSLTEAYEQADTLQSTVKELRAKQEQPGAVSELIEQVQRRDALLTEAQKQSAYFKSKLDASEAVVRSQAPLEEAIREKDLKIKELEIRLQDTQTRLEAAEETATLAVTQKEAALQFIAATREELDNVRREADEKVALMDGEITRVTSSSLAAKESAEAQLAITVAENKTLVEAGNELGRLLASNVAAYDDLQRKYKEEMAKRKQLFNRLQEIQGNIRVYCRVRPLSQREEDEGLRPVITFPEADTVNIYDQEKMQGKAFDFERVYPTDSRQEQVFVDVEPLITSVLDGFHVCIFAYGQTGSGKTYTMEGPAGDTMADPGVNIRALNELFRLKQERAESFDIDITCTIMEIHNDSIRDLLCDPSLKKKLDLKQRPDKSGAVYVPDVVEIAVTSPEEIHRLIETGRENRATGVTKANEHSSRSHCILGISVSATNKVNRVQYVGKLNLVDLAGSERLNVSGVTGEAQAEAISINKSLSALGDVIYALANKQSHIPYRNSKLTHLLQDSLSSDSKALMFVQISPNPRHVQESMCSLQFASRVRSVELGAARAQQRGDGKLRAQASSPAMTAGPLTPRKK
eukprot:TRINITY_DN7173_c0_g1_i1.p1 TRINITY_DN7173_c0_g1~~TRINITY_DN7173_c0_g1_i1.p1  ORF type:complete len:1138 (+),score=298.42 TRINITY_DN7173_c0_g1_i1:111-3524(+)